jgi:hypothetical protein
MKVWFTLVCCCLISNWIVAQSDQPCGAPLMPVSADSCHYAWGTTVGATYQNDTANGLTPPCGSPGAADVWYRFVVPAGGAVAVTTLEGTMTDGAMALYRGNCGALQFVQCEDDNGVNMMPVIDRSDLIPGDTMYIRVWYGFNPNGTGTFRICFVESNSDCHVATPLCQERYFYLHAYGPGSQLDALGTQCDIYEYQSQWFKWKILTPGTMDFSILPDSLNGYYPDWDWLLYRTMDSVYCDHFVAGSAPYACNGSSSYGPMGETGLGALGTSNSVPAGPGNPYCPIIQSVAQGEWFYLILNNFTTSSSGFRIRVGGTCGLDCDILNPPTGLLPKTDLKAVSVYPNPAEDWVTVALRDWQGLGQLALQVVDLRGAVLAVDAPFENGAFRLDLRRYAAGIYFFEVRAETGVVGRGKFLKR